MVEEDVAGPDDGPAGRGEEGGRRFEEEEGGCGPWGGEFGDVLAVLMLCWVI